jgi:hypothetical protein
MAEAIGDLVELGETGARLGSVVGEAVEGVSGGLGEFGRLGDIAETSFTTGSVGSDLASSGLGLLETGTDTLEAGSSLTSELGSMSSSALQTGANALMEGSGQLFQLPESGETSFIFNTPAKALDFDQISMGSLGSSVSSIGEEIGTIAEEGALIGTTSADTVRSSTPLLKGLRSFFRLGRRIGATAGTTGKIFEELPLDALSDSRVTEELMNSADETELFSRDGAEMETSFSGSRDLFESEIEGVTSGDYSLTESDIANREDLFSEIRSAGQSLERALRTAGKIFGLVGAVGAVGGVIYAVVKATGALRPNTTPGVAASISDTTVKPPKNGGKTKMKITPAVQKVLKTLPDEWYRTLAYVDLNWFLQGVIKVLPGMGKKDLKLEKLFYLPRNESLEVSRKTWIEQVFGTGIEYAEAFAAVRRAQNLSKDRVLLNMKTGLTRAQLRHKRSLTYTNLQEPVVPPSTNYGSEDGNVKEDLQYYVKDKLNTARDPNKSFIFTSLHHNLKTHLNIGKDKVNDEKTKHLADVISSVGKSVGRKHPVAATKFALPDLYNDVKTASPTPSTDGDMWPTITNFKTHYGKLEWRNSLFTAFGSPTTSTSNPNALANQWMPNHQTAKFFYFEPCRQWLALNHIAGCVRINARANKTLYPFMYYDVNDQKQYTRAQDMNGGLAKNNLESDCGSFHTSHTLNGVAENFQSAYRLGYMDMYQDHPPTIDFKNVETDTAVTGINAAESVVEIKFLGDDRKDIYTEGARVPLRDINFLEARLRMHRRDQVLNRNSIEMFAPDLPHYEEFNVWLQVMLMRFCQFKDTEDGNIVVTKEDWKRFNKLLFACTKDNNYTKLQTWYSILPSSINDEEIYAYWFQLPLVVMILDAAVWRSGDSKATDLMANHKWIGQVLSLAWRHRDLSASQIVNSLGKKLPILPNKMPLPYPMPMPAENMNAFKQSIPMEPNKVLVYMLRTVAAFLTSESYCINRCVMRSQNKFQPADFGAIYQDAIRAAPYDTRKQWFINNPAYEVINDNGHRQQPYNKTRITQAQSVSFQDTHGAIVPYIHKPQWDPDQVKRTAQAQPDGDYKPYEGNSHPFLLTPDAMVAGDIYALKEQYNHSNLWCGHLYGATWTSFSHRINSTRTTNLVCIQMVPWTCAYETDWLASTDKTPWFPDVKVGLWFYENDDDWNQCILVVSEWDTQNRRRMRKPTVAEILFYYMGINLFTLWDLFTTRYALVQTLDCPDVYKEANWVMYQVLFHENSKIMRSKWFAKLSNNHTNTTNLGAPACWGDGMYFNTQWWAWKVATPPADYTFLSVDDDVAEGVRKAQEDPNWKCYRCLQQDCNSWPCKNPPAIAKAPCPNCLKLDCKGWPDCGRRSHDTDEQSVAAMHDEESDAYVSESDSDASEENAESDFESPSKRLKVDPNVSKHKHEHITVQEPEDATDIYRTQGNRAIPLAKSRLVKCRLIWKNRNTYSNTGEYKDWPYMPWAADNKWYDNYTWFVTAGLVESQWENVGAMPKSDVSETNDKIPNASLSVSEMSTSVVVDSLLGGFVGLGLDVAYSRPFISVGTKYQDQNTEVDIQFNYRNEMKVTIDLGQELLFQSLFWPDGANFPNMQRKDNSDWNFYSLHAGDDWLRLKRRREKILPTVHKTVFGIADDYKDIPLYLMPYFTSTSTKMPEYSHIKCSHAWTNCFRPGMDALEKHLETI